MVRVMLDLEAVMIVMTLAREGSLARASRALGLPRTTLTRRITLLEQSLGVTLIERSQRHLRLTDAAYLLVDQGSPLVEAARQLEASISSGDAGRLRFAMPPGLGWDLIEPMLTLDDIQELGIELVHTDRDVHPIRDNFDVVASFARPTDGTLYCRSLLHFVWRCAASPLYIAKHGAPTSPSDLAKHPCIAVRAHGGISPFSWPLKAGGAISVHPWIVSTSLHTASQIMLAGRGIALLPDIPSETNNSIVILANEIMATGQIYLTMGQRLSESKRGRRLKGLIDQAVGYVAKARKKRS